MAIVTKKTGAAKPASKIVMRVDKSAVAATAKKDAADTMGSIKVPGFAYLKLTKGVHRLRIFPYIVSDQRHPDGRPENTLWYRRPVRLHFNIGPNKDVVMCPQVARKPCPVCEELNRLRKLSAISDSDFTAMKAKERDVYLVANLENPEMVYLLDQARFNFGTPLAKELDSNEDENVRGFFDLMEGYDLKVRMSEEKGMAGRAYLKADRIDFIERDEQPGDDFLEQLPKLDDFVQLSSYDDLKALVADVPAEIEDEPEPASEEEPEPVKKAAAKKAANPETEVEEPEVEEPEVEEPEVEDPEVEEPEPVKKAAAKKAANPEPEVEELACPEDGLAFGKDFNGYDVCDSCDLYEACQLEYAKLNKAVKKKK